MIIGDIARSIRQLEQPARKEPRRKPLPYAAAGLVDAAVMAQSQALRHLVEIIEKKPQDVIGKVALAIVEITRASTALAEVRQIQPE